MNFNIDPSLLRDVMAFDKASPLLFNSGLFLVLIALFLLVYALLRRTHTAKMLFVIAFSLYFYYKSSYVYCFILLGVCVADYVIGRALGRTKAPLGRRMWVLLNVVLNVGMLVYFKYFNLLYETFASITGTHFDPLNIILPAGISFFSFRSISYMVDIYRREIEPAKNFLDYTFYLTFFPPLLAGPIVRAKDMLPQVEARPQVTRAMVSEGLWLIMAGLVKKVIVADYISMAFVDRIFENPSLYTGFENAMGVMGFTIQLYCDFSGYSDMAIGLALLLGYRFKDNFKAPFKSTSPTDFWRRWHISLSLWLRDYVYIPMGGNRKGKHRQKANIFSTMLIGGLWHGASWMYMLWGAYNGILLILHKSLTKLMPLPDRLRGKRFITAGNIVVTFVLIAVGFIFFRSGSLHDAGAIGTQIFTHFTPEVVPAFVMAYPVVCLLILGAFIMHFLPTAWNGRAIRLYTSAPLVVQAVILAVVIFIVIQARQSDLVPFIYLQY